MPAYRSRTTTHGRNMAGARGLWRATGMKDGDFGKPIIAVVNSFTQFVPGHVHLKDLGQLVAREIEAAGGVAKEFNTIAVDDGIAMGHDGMLYSLPSRELIADSVEYMVNAHCADAMVCISNCDKITPGMLMAALRLNIPTVFVSGGPMEAGKVVLERQDAGARPRRRHGRRRRRQRFATRTSQTIERSACPTCGSCSGMFTANSMNCLTEALGLSLPGNGSTLATHADRKRLFVEAGHLIVDLARRYYEQDDATVLPRTIATQGGLRERHDARHRHGRLDQHGAAPARRRARGRGRLHHGRHRPAVAPRAGAVQGRAGQVPTCTWRTCTAPAASWRSSASSTAPACSTATLPTVHAPTLGDALDHWDISRTKSESVRDFFIAAPGGVPTQAAFSQDRRWDDLDLDRENGVIRSRRARRSPRMAASPCSTATSRSTAAS